MKLIIILSLFAGSLFAQYNITPEQLLKIVLMQENYTYSLSLDSLNKLEIIQYKILVKSQAKVIVNKSKINQTMELQLKEEKKKTRLYQFISIGCGVVVGGLVVRNL